MGAEGGGVLQRCRAKPCTRRSHDALPCAFLAAALSRKIHDGLVEISMIDEDGNVLEDPR